MSKSRLHVALNRSGIPDMLRGELKRHGVTDSHIEGGKHPALVFTLGRQRVRFHFPATPSCSRAGLNAVAGLRRRIREVSQ